ncbi:MAG: hypothetical protein HYT76_05040 [Deltaproteobacteria bacterium]|nr:hypothetical protein [Deltaproteobacteria bacterium]
MQGIALVMTLGGYLLRGVEVLFERIIEDDSDDNFDLYPRDFDADKNKTIQA